MTLMMLFGFLGQFKYIVSRIKLKNELYLPLIHIAISQTQKHFYSINFAFCFAAEPDLNGTRAAYMQTMLKRYKSRLLKEILL